MADPLNPVVQVESGYERESEGDFHLVTVRGGRATPIQLAISLFSRYHDVFPMDVVFPEGYDREAYLRGQLLMMENSQEAAVIVAFDQAGIEYDITYEGVYVVDVLEGMPAANVLMMGDRIRGVAGEPVEDADHLIDIVNQYEVGDTLTFSIEREESTFDVDIELVPFVDRPEDFGIGIHLVTNRDVSLSKDISFDSGDIGGPSAGIVLALELYDQLTPGDLTGGRLIAGTGEVDYDGNVGRIGGVDKKVVAADREGCVIFFVPNEGGREGSNYQLAKETADAINSDMEIVPIDSFEEALTYLLALDPL